MPGIDGEDASPGAPTSIGRYRIDRRIGAGAMGIVWLAHDPALDRPVALKHLRDVETPGELDRIQHEARAAAAVVHPNVVTIYDVGTANGRVFVAMEYVDGESLAQWLATPRSWRVVLDVLVQAGRALAAAHGAGIVHRDFKPDNVLVDRQGCVKVVDFGIATAVESPGIPSGPASGGGTTTTRWLGSPAYMAPERHAGERGDTRSDQFSFGVTAFEALWGVRPFAGESVPEVVASICDGRLVRPPRGPVPSPVQQAVLRALATRPDDRHVDMDTLVRRLHRARRGRARTLAWLGAAGGVLASTALLVARDPGCDGGGSHLRELDGARTRLQSRWPDVGDELDAWTEAWTRTHRESCERARQSSEDADALDRRTACLKQQLGSTRATIEVAAEHADSDAGAALLVHGLPRPPSCLEDTTRMPAEAIAELEAIDADLARAHALWILGMIETAAPIAADVLARAEAYPSTRTWVRAANLQASIAIQNGRLQEAETLVERAYSEAVAADDAVTTMAAIQIQATLAHVREDGPALLLCARRAEVQAARDTSDRSEWPMSLDVMLSVGHRLTGDIPTALVYGRRAVERIDAQPVVDYGSVQVHVDLAGTMMTAGRFDEAEAELRRAQANAALLPGRAGDPRALEATMARLQLMRRRADRALEQLLVTSARLAADGELATDTADTVVCLIEDALRELENSPLTLRYAERCAEKGARMGERSPAYARAQVRMASALDQNGRADEALAHAERAVAILEEVHGTRHADLASALGVSARLTRKQGDAARADALERRALELYESTNAGGGNHIASLLRTGREAIDRGDFPSAERRLQRGLELATARQGSDGTDTVLLAVQKLRLRARTEGGNEGLRAEALRLRERVAPLVGIEPRHAMAALAEVLGERRR